MGKLYGMVWKGSFCLSSDKPFTVDGKEAGVLKSHGPLSFLKVRYIYYAQSAAFFI